MTKAFSALPRVDTLVLAGGNSRRMGSDKALLLWQGIPLLRRVAQVAAACTERVYILTPWPERYTDVVDPGWHLWRESAPHRGPLLAFQEGVARLQAEAIPPDWVLLLACDMPCLDEQVLWEWRHRLGSLPPEMVAALPKTQRGWEPLCGFYRLSQMHQLEAFLQTGGGSFQDWLSGIPTVVLPLWQAQMLTNCNVPADLEGANP
ncbi:molybdenum cofactor guanylyltransferase [Thermostichus vulcanus]|uniref:Probable molybdenum cofactor guanylyltransferase n=1 Tax=Thermostichus vulcanus str. 'Rupite' TaxID=2813851 RepID=A0ABT0C861_THEVL|nr:molybdenum cofactor guanylyltransferase [Thermostichus vulcanus]MCJ2541983.1 molybdenum cofactor guanylyltransferase [Thermostichus vulcanus str. 'Rupite']